MPENAPNGDLKLMAIVKAAVCVLLVATTSYCVIAGIEIPGYFVQLLIGVLGVYFGYSALLYKRSADATNGHLVNVVKLVAREEVRQQLATLLEERKDT